MKIRKIIGNRCGYELAELYFIGWKSTRYWEIFKGITFPGTQCNMSCDKCYKSIKLLLLNFNQLYAAYKKSFSTETLLL